PISTCSRKRVTRPEEWKSEDDQAGFQSASGAGCCPMVRSPIPGLFCPDTDRTPAAFPARLNAQRIPTHLRGLYRRAAVQQRLVLPGNAAVLGIEPGPAAAPHRVGAVVSNLSADGRNGNRAAQCHKIHRSPAVDVSRRTAGAAAGVLPVCDQSNTVVEPARSAAAGA